MPFELDTVTNPVPEWARWLAQDEDGEWYVYEERPQLAEYGLVGVWVGRGTCYLVTTEVVDWQNSLVDLSC